MKNKEITIYELIGLIKDNKAPKKIKYENIILKYDEVAQDYKANSCFNNDTNYLLCHLFRYAGALDTKVEILPEENDEWEDIEEYDLKPDDWSTPTQADMEIQKRLNAVIKNQKYLKERLENKDE